MNRWMVHVLTNALLMVLPFVVLADSKEKPSRPLLLVLDEDWAAYKERVTRDERLDPVRQFVIRRAEEVLNEPLAAYDRPDGRRLPASVLILERILLLGQAFHLTGNDSFAERAVREVLHSAEFPDWNSDHFLDAAHLATATSLVLDWLPHHLSAEQRLTLQKALIEKCLGQQEGHWFWINENNWQQVCSAGVLLAAIQTRDLQPVESARLIRKFRDYVYFGFKPYTPDGIPEEGPAYWHYGNTFSCIAFAAQETALGVPAAGALPEHFKKTALVRTLLDGPSGMWFGYSDSRGSASIEPALFFLAQVNQDPRVLENQWRLIASLQEHLVQAQRESPQRPWLLPLVLLWADSSTSSTTAPVEMPRVWSGRGKNPLAVLRDGDQAYVAIKGGSALNHHGHMDAGSFVVDLGQRRWAVDLGLESYANAEKVIGMQLWDSSQESPRWSLLRYHNLQHNTLTVNGQRQRVDGQTVISRVGESPGPFAVLDLSPAYAGNAARVTRGVRLIDQETLDVVDSVEGVIDAQQVTWSWITDAKVETTSPHALRLSKDNRTAYLTIREPTGARFDVSPVDATRREFESENGGVTAVRVHLQGPNHRIWVRLSLNETGQAPAPSLDLREWR